MRVQGTRQDPVRIYDLIDIANRVSESLYDNNVIVDNRNPRQLSPRAAQFRLRVRDSSGPGARRSATGRRMPAACWHAYRDVIRAILTAHPDATVRTGMALYKTLRGFEQAYPATAYANVGSLFQPALMPDLCECGSELQPEPKPAPVKTEIQVNDTVTHPSGWTGTVLRIKGKLWGSRVLTVREFDGYTSDWLECVFTEGKQD